MNPSTRARRGSTAPAAAAPSDAPHQVLPNIDDVNLSGQMQDLGNLSANGTQHPLPATPPVPIVPNGTTAAPNPPVLNGLTVAATKQQFQQTDRNQTQTHYGGQ